MDGHVGSSARSAGGTANTNRRLLVVHRTDAHVSRKGMEERGVKGGETTGHLTRTSTIANTTNTRQPTRFGKLAQMRPHKRGGDNLLCHQHTINLDESMSGRHAPLTICMACSEVLTTQYVGDEESAWRRRRYSNVNTTRTYTLAMSYNWASTGRKTAMHRTINIIQYRSGLEAGS